MRSNFALVVLSSLVLLAGLVFLLRNSNAPPEGGQLRLYCAQGIRKPMEKIIEEYRKEFNVDVIADWAGSGDLRSKIEINNRGDLFLAADVSYLTDMQHDNDPAKRKVREILPLAFQRPVIAVKKGNPKKVTGLEDLLRDDLRTSLANADAAAISKVARKRIGKERWSEIFDKKSVERATVSLVAADVSDGLVDAGIIWDATADQYEKLEYVSVPELDVKQNQISLGVLEVCQNPQLALHFARYASAPEKGLKYFKQFGYRPADGDVWASEPEITFFSGGLNWTAAQELVDLFQKREGCKVVTKFGGCGGLVSDMKLGQRPDAYFSCDVSYMKKVQDLFLESENVTGVDIILAVQKGNPLGIEKLEDLKKEGLRVGVCDPTLSTLGDLTKQLLERHNMYEVAMKQVDDQPPTAARLVGHVVLGRMDVAIVYRANTVKEADHVDVIDIEDSSAYAVQPIAVGRESKHKLLAGRLMDFIASQEARPVFEKYEFDWVHDKDHSKGSPKEEKESAAKVP